MKGRAKRNLTLRMIDVGLGKRELNKSETISKFYKAFLLCQSQAVLTIISKSEYLGINPNSF